MSITSTNNTPAQGGMAATAPHPLAPRSIGAVNWIGLQTLFVKEVMRFLKVATQTVLAPVVTTLLFYAVFALALGGLVRTAGTVPFLEFLAPGLVMMGIAQNAFANTSSSIIISKVQGNIVDLLMPPLSHFEVAAAYVGAAVVRGLMVGAVTLLSIVVFVPVGLHSPFFVLYHAVMASMMMGLLGLLGGIWAEKFDHLAAVTNFVITPLTFLSGTFYTIDRLPLTFQILAHVNPFFYMIDGFRYGFIGQSDGTLLIGLAVLALVNGGLGWLLLRLLATGYRLRA